MPWWKPRFFINCMNFRPSLHFLALLSSTTHSRCPSWHVLLNLDFENLKFFHMLHNFFTSLLTKSLWLSLYNTYGALKIVNISSNAYATSSARLRVKFSCLEELKLTYNYTLYLNVNQVYFDNPWCNYGWWIVVSYPFSRLFLKTGKAYLST